jgi:phage-related protein/predicted  nucleic acid-binding Zn-ribbon protein
MADEAIKGLAVKIALEDGTFQQGVTNLKQNLSVINSEFKASVSGVKDWGNSLDALKNNATSLGEKITVQKQIVQAYEQQLQKSKDALSANSDKMIELKNKLDATKSAYEASKTAVGANDEATKKLKNELDLLNKEYTSSEGLVRKNNTSVNGYTIQVNNAKGAMNGLQSELKQTNEQIKKQSTEFNGLSEKINSKVNSALKGLAIGIAGAAVGMGALIMKSAESADKIQTAADIYGLTAERIQELTYVGTKLDVELETITKAQSMLTKNMYLAEKGTGAQAVAFDTLGISVKDSNGNLRDGKVVMDEAITALSKMPNETERDAIAMKVFGKSAMELNPLIKAGSTEIARLTDEAHKSGAVLSNEAVAGLDGFADSTEALKLSLQGAIGQALTPLIPKLQEFADKLKNMDTKPLTDGLKWVMDNGQTIVTVVLSVVGALVVWKIAVFASIAAQEIHNAILIVSALAHGGLSAATMALTAATGGKVAATLIASGAFIAHNIALVALAVAHGVAAAAMGIATAAQWLLNIALGANPIGAIILLIVGLIAVVVLIATHWKEVSAVLLTVWKVIVSAFDTSIKAIGGFFVGLWNGIVSIFSPIVKWFGDIFNAAWKAIVFVFSAYIGFWVGLFNGVVAVFTPIVKWFGQLFTALFVIAVKIITPLINFCIGIFNAIVAIFTPIVKWFGDLFTAAWNGIVFVFSVCTTFFTNVWNGIVGIFSVVGKWFGDVFQAAWNAIVFVFSAYIGFWVGLWNGIVGIFTPIISWFGGVFAAAWNGIKSAFSAVGGFFQGIFNTVVGVFGNIGTAIGNAVSGAFKMVINGVLSVVEGFVNTIINGINTVTGFLTHISGVEIGVIQPLNIPKMSVGTRYLPSDMLLQGHEGEMIVPRSENPYANSGGGTTLPVMTHNHTGTIRVEGVNTKGELSGVVDIIIDELRKEVRR